MAIANLNHWEKKALAKSAKREKKKKPKMKVSGASVKRLQKIINEK
ncbi:MAG: hypothetical protein PHE24_01000 [Patescibacteria group bacterium]|nr:hypothetical protein [Patescibacteria group bacterium]